MQEQILDALRQVRDPDLDRDIVSLGFVKDLKACDGIVAFTIELTTPACPVRDQMKQEAHRRVMAVSGVKQVDIQMTAQVRPSRSEQRAMLIQGVRNIVPVASGKGGVGKSTVSANLALALAKLGARVGLMDADIYGPSIPTMLATAERVGKRGEKLSPVETFGIQVISMGFLLGQGEAAIMRGPMLAKYAEAFLAQVDWGELDYLILDLPPGTGDIPLSLCQLVALTGAAVVSTPQDVALKVAEKAIIMFQRLNTPILGILENMSGHVCSQCGHREDIFGAGGARQYALQRGIPFLGEIPLATEVRRQADAGTPIVAALPDSPPARAFIKAAENLAAQVSVVNSGGRADGRPAPREIHQPSRQQLVIQWSDGREGALNAWELRVACPCAHCVDEMTGRPRLDPASVPKDVWPTSLSPVGRYALNFVWSDGHSSGIYTYELLRRLSKLEN